MKIICVLISFVFVNVSADITPYLQLIAVTNKHIQIAYQRNYDIVGNGLEYVIKAIVCENVFTIEKMNFMIAVPEYASIAVNQRLGIPVPNPANLRNYFGNLNLTNLGVLRRRFTKKALTNIIRRELIGNETDGEPERVTFSEKCLFLGLWMSTNIPTFYTKSAVTGTNSDCVITDIANHVMVYRSIEGKYWQVDANDINHRIILLDEQLY
ncbi:uncharacterized protein LOC126847938 isoform X4 [Adelges cooleyi]|uniref:uncharacterized protein LOC126834482 isoform X3 n=1 Tax=Adelges cooleyi TaxID=133065 RepID=UPI00217F91E4|nr:uncharacterized protein LOC126834482 isoform X3 [Adelges cooleyi]XP_050444374.1 uncharacterized protein LOC126847938 isoform X4 [Adelges cooleyi]